MMFTGMMGILDCLIDSPMRPIFFTVFRVLSVPGLFLTEGLGGGKLRVRYI